jgi:hypothetical protein
MVAFPSILFAASVVAAVAGFHLPAVEPSVTCDPCTPYVSIQAGNPCNVAFVTIENQPAPCVFSEPELRCLSSGSCWGKFEFIVPSKQGWSLRQAGPPAYCNDAVNSPGIGWNTGVVLASNNDPAHPPMGSGCGLSSPTVTYQLVDARCGAAGNVVCSTTLSAGCSECVQQGSPGGS